MALSIKDQDTDRLARELARTTGESLTEAIRKALEERLLRERTRLSAHSLAGSLSRIREGVVQLPVLDSRSAQELLGYDDAGLPT